MGIMSDPRGSGGAPWGRLGESDTLLWIQGVKPPPLPISPAPSLCNFHADLAPKDHLAFSRSPLLVSLKRIKPNLSCVAYL